MSEGQGLGRETRRYALLGAAFGAAFPIVATVVLMLEQGLPASFGSVIDVQTQSALVWIIDTAPVFLGLFAAFAGRRQDRVNQILAAREDVIAERTRDLALANQALAELFDNMQQAVFSVDSEGRLDPQFSAHTRDLFGDIEFEGASVLDVLRLRDDGQEQRQHMQNWMEVVLGQDELQWMMTADQPVRELEIKSDTLDDSVAPKVVEVEYVPIYREGLVAKIMVIARDVTELRALAHDVQVKDRQLRVVAEVLRSDRTQLEEFAEEFRASLSETDTELQSTSEREEAVAVALRCAHTIKGNARTCELPEVERTAHEVERTLEGLDDTGASGQRAAELLQPLRDLLDDVGKTLGHGSQRAEGGGVNNAVDPARRKKLEAAWNAVEAWLGGRGLGEQLENGQEIGEMRQVVGAISASPLAEIGGHLEKTVADLSAETGKPVKLQFHCDGVRVSPTIRSVIRDVSVHALRNAIDHGVEGPAERTSEGKPLEAVVDVRVASHGDALTLVVQDDGRGVDLEALRRKGVERGLYTDDDSRKASPDAILDLIFHPGLSTREQVTAISGRGTGMDLIRWLARRHGGDATLQSEPGQGTALTVRLSTSPPPPTATHSTQGTSTQGTSTRGTSARGTSVPGPVVPEMASVPC